MNDQLRYSGPWVSAIGVVTTLIGLTWDAVLHSMNADLAAHESVFSLTNPGHVLLAAGIALSAAGSILFLIGQARENSRASRLVALSCQAGLLVISALFVISFAFALTDMH